MNRLTVGQRDGPVSVERGSHHFYLDCEEEERALAAKHHLQECSNEAYSYFDSEASFKCIEAPAHSRSRPCATEVENQQQSVCRLSTNRRQRRVHHLRASERRMATWGEEDRSQGKARSGKILNFLFEVQEQDGAHPDPKLHASHRCRLERLFRSANLKTRNMCSQSLKPAEECRRPGERGSSRQICHPNPKSSSLLPPKFFEATTHRYAKPPQERPLEVTLRPEFIRLIEKIRKKEEAGRPRNYRLTVTRSTVL
jgi:hypothetical protein